MSMSLREQLASATMIATHELVMNLEKTKSAVESLVLGMQDFTCLATSQGRVVWGNGCAASTLSCDPDHLHQQNLKSIFRGSDWDYFRAMLKTYEIAGLNAKAQEFQLPIKQGSEVRDILWSIRPFQAVSTRRGILLLLMGRDITDVLRERSKRARLEGELETAQLMQAAFFPPNKVELPKLSICSFYRAAERCSGDWWGHFNLGDQLDLICIADVTGHGAASALVTAMTQATCLSFASKAREDRKRGREIKVEDLMRHLNIVIFDTFKGETFMTFFAMLFNTGEGVLRSCNAGHNFPLMLRGKLRQAAKQEAELTGPFKNLRWPEVLMVRGNPLGYERSSKFTEHTLTLEDEDRFMMYTDGFIECRNEQQKMFGASALCRTMIKNIRKDTGDFIDSMVKDALDHYGDEALTDDLTMVVIDVKIKP